MTKHLFLVLLLSALAVGTLCACGDTVTSESEVEGIQTFGETIDPSATPSTGVVIESTVSPSVSSGDNSSNGSSSGSLNGSSDASTGNSSGSSTGTSSGSSGSGTSSGSSSGSGSSSSGSSAPAASPSLTEGEEEEEEDSPTPAISPPIAASTATMDEAAAYIGRPLSQLIAELGYPIRSDYDYVDETDPDAGEIGTLYFYGYIVTTLRTDSGETITGVSAT